MEKKLFNFQITTRILFGIGSIDNLSEEAAKLGRKVILVTYPDIRRVGLLDKVLNALKEKGIDTVVFEKVQCNPHTTTIDVGAELARKEKPDFIIGLGGGSVMDTAKGIALTTGGSAGVWLGPQDGSQDAGVLGTARLSASEASAATEAGPMAGRHRRHSRRRQATTA